MTPSLPDLVRDFFHRFLEPTVDTATAERSLSDRLKSQDDDDDRQAPGDENFYLTWSMYGHW